MSSEESSVSEELPEPSNRKRHGSHVVAVYEGEWFIAEVCIDQRQVASGYTRLMYMSIKGNKCFAWITSHWMRTYSSTTLCQSR